MSQVQEAPMAEEQQESQLSEAERDFDAGFDMDDEAKDTPSHSEPEQPQGQQAAQEHPQQEVPPMAQQTSPQPMSEPQQQMQQPLPQSLPPRQPTPSAIQEREPVVPPAPRQAPNTDQLIEIPEQYHEELERLKKKSPEAAALAQENSLEGEQVRDLLQEYGASVAYESARTTLIQRNRAVQEQNKEQQRIQEAVQRQNAYFTDMLQREQPAYLQLCQDKNRRPEALIKDIFDWIGSKPYAEGARLMPIAQGSRNPHEISALLNQYQKERNVKIGQPRQPSTRRGDPTGAIAVPSRGAPVAPAGIGDQDSFDAGWNLNESDR